MGRRLEDLRRRKKFRGIAELSGGTTLAVVAKVIDATAISTRSAVDEAGEGIDAQAAAGFQGGRAFAHAAGASACACACVVAGSAMAVVCVFVDASAVA